MEKGLQNLKAACIFNFLQGIERKKNPCSLDGKSKRHPLIESTRRCEHGAGICFKATRGSLIQQEDANEECNPHRAPHREAQDVVRFARRDKGGYLFSFRCRYIDPKEVRFWIMETTLYSDNHRQVHN